MPPDDLGLPLFYKSPRLLLANAHTGCGIEPARDFGFAAETNSVPIGAEEFYEAQAHYPIVFTATEPVVALSVLGLEQKRNLFLDSDKKWLARAYVPAYVRRYPFVFISSGGDNFVLGIDEEATSFSRSGGEPLFEGGEPSAITKRALNFCSAFELQFRIAREFAAALKSNDLLVPHRADVRGASGQATKSLSGFTVIDERRLTAVSDDLILDWRKRGWLGLVYAHLLSMRRWTDLAALVEASTAA